MNWYLETWRKWKDFGGRSRRTEYWMFVLVNALVSGAIWLLELMTGTAGMISYLYSLVVLVPSLAVTVRRLHDTDHDTLWVLAMFVPLLNILVLYFLVLDSTPGANRFGPNPKGF